MADLTTIRYKLVGPHAGKTIGFNKGQFQFVDGCLEETVREDQKHTLDGLTAILGRGYNAHIEGSAALAKAEAEWAENPNNPKYGQKHAQAGKAGTGRTPVQAAGRDGAHGAKAGAEGHGAAAGDAGGADGDDGADLPGAEDSPLVAALKQLDPGDDGHWTNTGLPSVKAVGHILGEAVSRGDIEEALPGFTRDTATGGF